MGKKKTVEELIVDHLEDNGQKLSWLADRIGLSVSHLHHVLKGERELKEQHLLKINEVLNTLFKK